MRSPWAPDLFKPGASKAVERHNNFTAPTPSMFRDVYSVNNKADDKRNRQHGDNRQHGVMPDDYYGQELSRYQYSEKEVKAPRQFTEILEILECRGSYEVSISDPKSNSLQKQEFFRQYLGI